MYVHVCTTSVRKGVHGSDEALRPSRLGDCFLAMLKNIGLNLRLRASMAKFCADSMCKEFDHSMYIS